jgi:hypothetical protein
MLCNVCMICMILCNTKHKCQQKRDARMIVTRKQCEACITQNSKSNPRLQTHAGICNRKMRGGEDVTMTWHALRPTHSTYFPHQWCTALGDQQRRISSVSLCVSLEDTSSERTHTTPCTRKVWNCTWQTAEHNTQRVLTPQLKHQQRSCCSYCNDVTNRCIH